MVSLQKQQFRSDTGTDCLFAACNHGMQTVNHATALSATTSPGNLPRLPSANPKQLIRLTAEEFQKS